MDTSRKVLDYKKQARTLHQNDIFHLGEGNKAYTALILIDDNGLATNQNVLHVQMDTKIQVLAWSISC